MNDDDNHAIGLSDEVLYLELTSEWILVDDLPVNSLSELLELWGFTRVEEEINYLDAAPIESSCVFVDLAQVELVFPMVPPLESRIPLQVSREELDAELGSETSILLVVGEDFGLARALNSQIPLSGNRLREAAIGGRLYQGMVSCR